MGRISQGSRQRTYDVTEQTRHIGEPDGYTLHLTLRTTAIEAVEASVSATNSLSQDYPNLDDHISQTSIDTPRFKPFTLYYIIYILG